MKLLVILICLLSERFLIHSAFSHRFIWFPNYYKLIEHYLEKNTLFNSPWLVLVVIILPIMIPVALFYFVLENVFFGFFGLILSSVIFIYCLGPQNAFYPVSESNSDIGNTSLIGSYFAQVNSQLFAVIFWYVISGPIMVLAYRLVTLSKNLDSVREPANQIADIMEWIPARISALLLLLVGNFQRGFLHFTQLFFSRPELNNQLLSSCGLQAVRTGDSEEIPMPVAENLVEQAAIVLLVLIALFTLVSWL